MVKINWSFKELFDRTFLNCDEGMFFVLDEFV